MKKENSFKFRKVFVVVCCLMFIFPLGNNGILVSMAQDNDDDISSNFTHTEITALNSYSEGLIYQNSSYENSYRNIFQTGSFNQYLTEKNIILDNDYATDLNTSCLVSQYYLDDNINQMLVNDSELIQFYDGSYNFDFDLVSDFITNDTSGSGCSATEITLSNNHLNVLDMYDNSNSQVAWIEHDFKQYISSSTIEFYWYNTRIGGSLTRGMVNFYENATEIFRLHFSGTGSDANDLYIYDGGWSEIGSNVFVQETWYHLRIDYDIDLDTYDVFLDNVSLANDISFINDVSNGLSFMTIRTEGADISYHHYYDSFSITGINGYSLNDLYLLTDMETYTDDFIDFYIFNERNLYEIGTGSYKTYLYFGLENMSLYLNSENIFNRINYSVSYINSLEFEIQYILFTNVSGTWLNAKYSIFINNVLIYEKYTYRQLMYLVGYDWMLYLENDKLYSFLGNNINCIRGIRHLYKIDGNTAIFYDFPRFNDQIIFDIPITPEFYDETKYWSYITFQLEEDFTENVSFSQEIKIGAELKLFKFAYNFTHTKAVIFNAKYNYYDEVIKNRDWGNWGIFNWVRNGLVAVVNGLLLGIQFIGFLIVAGVSILFGGLFIALIIPFVWNILLYYVLFALVWVLFYLWIGLSYLVGWFIYLLKPFFSFLFTVVIPFLIYLLIELFSWILALLLWVITLGSANLNDLYMIINTFLTNIADFFISALSELGNYLPELFTYFSTYVILVGLCFIKLEYTQAKGIVNRSNQLSSSLNAYMIPIKIGSSLVLKIKNILFGWI